VGLLRGLVAALLMLLAVPAAAAGERIHGVVLAVTPQSGEAVVRHDAFGGMPSMAMPFRIVPRERLGAMQPGNRIEATVDRTTEPWTLRDLTIVATEAVTAPAARRVAPLHLGDDVPDGPFVDQNGRPFRFTMLRGNDVVLAFIYTRCQDARMCPLISAKFNQLQRKARDRKLRLVEVTLDPSYDRPPVLARYARTFGADARRWTLAVGDAGPTLDFAARFGVTAFPDPNAGIVHAENTVEIDRQGRIRLMLPDASWEPDEILADVDAMNGLSTNPLVRFDLWLSRMAVAVCGNAVAGFSGLTDLGILLSLLAALCYLFYRLAKTVIPSPSRDGSKHDGGGPSTGSG
jgi:protein SCO1/2